MEDKHQVEFSVVAKTSLLKGSYPSVKDTVNIFKSPKLSKGIEK